MNTLLELLYNLGILISIGIIVGEYGRHRKYSLYIQGLIFGTAALIGMLNPFILTKGLIFDGRSIMLSLAGVFFGPVTAVISAAMALTLRIYQGGIGRNMGILVILSSSAVGVFYNHYYYKKNQKIRSIQLYVMGIIVHLIMILCIFALPADKILLTIKNISLPVLIFYPIVTVFIGKIISEAEMKRKILEEFILFKDLAKNSTEGFGVISLDGKIKYLNEAIKKLMDFDKKFNESRKDSFEGFTNEKEEKLLNQIIPEVLKTGKSQDELILHTKLDEIIVLIENFFPIKNDKGKIIYIGYVVSDITKERNAAKKLERALIEAERANKAKINFIANMSHELRTPMNGILGISNMMAKYDATNLTKDQLEGLALINKSGKRLLGLINDVLDFSKVDSGEINAKVEKINLSKFLDEIESMVKSLLVNDSEKKDKIKFFINRDQNISNYIVSDEKFLNQILINLLGNAFKFTDNGKIVLEVYLKNDKLFFEVSDTGIGIKKEDLTKIFDKFTQLDDSLTKKYQGTGLGLNICKSLVEKLDGEITLESKYNFGTTVKFYIKYNSEMDNEQESQLEITEDNSKEDLVKKVLVIEDDEESRYLYGKYLERHNFQVLYAEDGEEGLKIINNENLDLIILDINLPKISGLEIIEILKEENTHFEIPIIIISVEDLNKEYHLYGLSDFISKPVTEERLIDSIKYIEIHSKEKRKKIMVIDDDEAELMQVKTFLRKNNYFVIDVKESENSFELIEKNLPDLIILDLLMPKVNGIEILNFIRNHPDEKISHIPVIVNSFKELSQIEFEEIKRLSNKILNKKSSSKENLVNLSMKLINEMNITNIKKDMRKILVAEDEEIGRETIRRMLKSEYELIFAENGKEAWDLAVKEKFDLILLDIRMPKMDGFETFAKIRNEGITVPIIALTAQAMEYDRDKIIDFGFDEYISKPIDYEEIVSKIEKFTSHVKI